MLSLVAPTTLNFAAPVVPSAARAPAVTMETRADLEALATKCNPVIGFYDPLALASAVPASGFNEEQTIGFLRHAEIKHGRVAMAAFVGYIAQSNVHFPWDLQNGVSYASIAAAGGPPDQWDAMPTSAKLQILGFIGLLEFFGEKQSPHYMRGGKPGAYPKFADTGVPHPMPLELFDPFGLSKNASPEKKERGLVAEINNGRLAQLGIFGFLAESKVPGSVPVLSGIVKPYSGEVMAPFSSVDSSLPFVSEMLGYKLPIDPWY